MRSLILLTVFLLFSLEAENHSILVPRSITHNATYELALNNYQIYHHPSCCSGEKEAYFSFYATPFYTQSANQNSLARYFLPNSSSSLNIQEDGSGNVGSLWLDLIADPGLYYSSTVKIAPVRKVVGSYFYFRLEMDHFAPDTCWWVKNMWFSASFAAMQVQHQLNISETLTGSEVYGTLPSISTGIEALNNPSWTAGKLSSSNLIKSGVDDIQLK